MNVFEMILFVINLTIIGVIILREPHNNKFSISLVFASVIALMVAITLAMRWQLYFLYGSTVILLSTLGISLSNRNFNRYIRRGLIGVSLSLIFVSFASVIIFPVYSLVGVNGEYDIGTISYSLTDEDRLELYTDQPNDNRKIKLQFWYPAKTTEGYQQAPWLDDGKEIARGLSNDIGLPYFVLDHTKEILSNSYYNAEVSTSQSSYPVVIVSHGWRGFRNIHTDYAEELASNGYIVVGIDHTYGSVATVFEEETMYTNHNALPPRETTPDFLNYANQLVSTYAADITTTLNHLETLDTSSLLYGKLDVSNVGLLGHSTGGGADVQVALTDPRVNAVIGLDAWVEPIDETTLNSTLTTPSLFLRSEAWEESYNNQNLYKLINNNSLFTQLYQIDGTTHYDFAMIYMYSPLTSYIGFSGDIDSYYLNSMLEEIILDFFNSTLINDNPITIDDSLWEELHPVRTD